ncbi:NADH dehydrogenase [ubiquinone] 1 alpha subcomplex assembly factor 4 [Leptinotarsa decemlineata]|uniref:NADH dehydrogenase [ubiquinone] 1 alpha subcomplex assembly factor 4 n=1 Tax=Leptinotarsa decemlineata TaxID=7539 RepID=UPI000C254839|nr:protein NDUFAF4 homolog [Leptinotarsa decemlineata]
MGKIFSTVKHPFRNFNLEYRAHKVISQPKPIPAPLHEKDQIDVERLMKEFPDVYAKSLQKDEKLDKHLKDIFVTSHDPNIAHKLEQNPERPLPTDRKAVETFLYGVKQSEKIPLGKVSLATALEFITNHQGDPRKYSAKKISEDCLLPEEKVNSILKYFKVFEVYVPLERTTDSKFVGPSEPKVRIIKELRKKLSPPDAKEKE